jgi:hypothetical protein
MRKSTAISAIGLPLGFWIPTFLTGASVEIASIMTVTTWLAIGVLRFNEWTEKVNDE